MFCSLLYQKDGEMGPKKCRLLEFWEAAVMHSLSLDEVQWLVDTGQLREIQICGKERVDLRDVDRLVTFYKRVQERGKKYAGKVLKFPKGEKQCRICGGPRLARSYSEAQKAVICGKAECQKAFYGKSRRWRWIGEGEIKCEGPECSNHVPPGRWHSGRRTHFFCSGGGITKFYLRW